MLPGPPPPHGEGRVHVRLLRQCRPPSASCSTCPSRSCGPRCGGDCSRSSSSTPLANWSSSRATSASRRSRIAADRRSAMRCVSRCDRWLHDEHVLAPANSVLRRTVGAARHKARAPVTKYGSTSDASGFRVGGHGVRVEDEPSEMEVDGVAEARAVAIAEPSRLIHWILVLVASERAFVFLGRLLAAPALGRGCGWAPPVPPPRSGPDWSSRRCRGFGAAAAARARPSHARRSSRVPGRALHHLRQRELEARGRRLRYRSGSLRAVSTTITP